MKETTTTPTRRELILGQPYDFYPYKEPTSRVHRRDGWKVTVTDAGIWRRVHKEPTA
jgi:hypothetical protein